MHGEIAEPRGHHLHSTPPEKPDLPLVVVVDDEVNVSGQVGRSRPLSLARHLTRSQAKQREYCERFGLVPEGEGHNLVDAPVARVSFVAPLQWTGTNTALPSTAAALAAIEHHVGGRSGVVALVLLDLHVGYGRLRSDGTFDAAHAEFGLRAVLPEILARYGTDETSPGSTWTRVPVVVVSALPKDALDEEVRRGGARGMISKSASPAQAREQLAGYLSGHGLLPDTRGLIVGRSLPLLNVLAAARRAAPGRSSVLLLGESGTGKELLARYIHDHSPRAARPYGVYHAAGRGDELQEDELFGHWSGAFTGALRDQPGILEELNGGTVFIDELGDLAPRVQNALLRPLQERQAARIGRPRDSGERLTSLDLKFVFATNKDLHGAAATNAFRHDLLQRVSETVVRLPPLRDRREDLPGLVAHFLRRYGPATGVREMSPDALAALAQYEFPGNVRQLEHVVQRAVAIARGPAIERADLPEDVCAPRRSDAAVPPPPDGGVAAARDRAERDLILAALGRNTADLAGAARELQISRTTLWRLMKKHNIPH